MPRLKQKTIHHKAFARAYVKHNFNGAQAALETTRTTNPKAATVVANQLLKYPDVQQEIENVLNSAGLSLEQTAAIHAQAAIAEPQKPITWNEKIRAVEMSYKLHKAFPANKSIVGHLNLNKQYQGMTIHDLEQRLNELRAKRQALQEV